ncbi:MAG: indolepyruvate ferredoxin oxidoreductase subunit beta [Acidobacteriota bacterium]|jgi:indolepyruvate ferredoxin oxidoreductase beta subunit
MATPSKEVNIVICGVGGQGVVLMSELLGHAAVQDGLKILGSEVLGMAQRGGPVFSNIRIGSDVYAPLTPEGKGDLMVAVEPSEALRNITFLSKSSLVVLNTRKVIPYTVSSGESGYPSLEVIMARLNQAAKKVMVLDAAHLAEEAGHLQSTNVVMLGALFGTRQMPIQTETINRTIAERFSPKVADVNIRAFGLGYEAIRKTISCEECFKEGAMN